MQLTRINMFNKRGTWYFGIGINTREQIGYDLSWAKSCGTNFSFLEMRVNLEVVADVWCCHRDR